VRDGRADRPPPSSSRRGFRAVLPELLFAMSRRPRPSGFTLIELIVVIAIAATLLGATVVSINALTGARARSALGELGGTMRALYDTAALTGHTCRLVFDLPPGDTTGFSYRAECASRAVTSASDRDQALKDDTQARADALKRGPTTGRRGASLLDVLSQEKDRVEAAAKFSIYTSPEVEPRRVSGVKLSVWTPHQRQPAKSGLAYVYFFPQGAVERAQLTARQGGSVWTLTVSPVTGQTAVVDGELQVPKS
jgi:general secretion pathway protein H